MKWYTYRWFVRWFVPFPIQLWYFKKRMGVGQLYRDDEVVLVLQRHTYERDPRSTLYKPAPLDPRMIKEGEVPLHVDLEP